MYRFKPKCVLVCEIGKRGKIYGSLERFSKTKPLAMDEDTEAAGNRESYVILVLGPMVPPLWPGSAGEVGHRSAGGLRSPRAEQEEKGFGFCKVSGAGN